MKSFTAYVKRNKRPATLLSFSISLDAENEFKHEPRKEKKKKTEEKRVIPPSFINHIKSLGFPESDAVHLFEHRDQWSGISIGSRVKCTMKKKRCSFECSPVGDEMSAHYRDVHGWRDFPCDKPHCTFVAYSKSSFNQHKAGHGRLKSASKEFKCTVPDCSATFDRVGLLEIHSRIHENRLFHCPFCPYSTTQSVNLVFHTRLHFGIADYACPACD